MINVVPWTPRLPHQKDNGFLPPVSVLARLGPGNELKKKKKKRKKNESGFSHKHLQVCAAGFCPQEPKCVYETQVDAHRDMNCTHRHTHAYTVLSFSVTHTHTEAVKVTAFIFHCVTGDPKYLHCLAAAVPEDLGRGEQRAPITQRRSSTSSSEYVPCLFV